MSTMNPGEERDEHEIPRRGERRTRGITTRREGELSLTHDCPRCGRMHMRKGNQRGGMPQEVGHVGDARRTIAANGPHGVERHEGEPGQRKQGSRHEDDGVAGPGAMAASFRRTP